MTTKTHNPTWTAALLVLVFFGGFANLATEIIGPRMMASMFGSATAIWAVIISVTLVGLSVGYALGGRISAKRAPRLLPVILIANALWLVAVSWLVWGIPATTPNAIDLWLITLVANVAFFPPSLLFGMFTPLAITMLSEGRSHEQTTTIVGNLYALGTIGSVMGALTAAFFWIPWVGLSLSLRIFAVILVLFAAYFSFTTWERLAYQAALLIAVTLMPQPDWVWGADENLRLVTQREGLYQPIRVYTDDASFLRIHLGPTFHSQIDIETGEPTFSYAVNMLAMIDTAQPDLGGKNALVIGGAGHALAHALENRGAQVTEVEIDPIVVEVSDRYFGEIEGEVVVADGRVFINSAPDDAYNVLIIDAFDGGTGVPPQLVTREFYEEVSRVLTPDGIMYFNVIGTPEGRNSGSYTAIAATMSDVFPAVGALLTREDDFQRQNIIFAASDDTLAPLTLTTPDAEGRVLTDDRNPIDILFEQARDGFYFRR